MSVQNKVDDPVMEHEEIISHYEMMNDLFQHPGWKFLIKEIIQRDMNSMDGNIYHVNDDAEFHRYQGQRRVLEYLNGLEDQKAVECQAYLSSLEEEEEDASI